MRLWTELLIRKGRTSLKNRVNKFGNFVKIMLYVSYEVSIVVYRNFFLDGIGQEL